MLQIIHLEEIRIQLLAVTNLVDKLEKKEVSLLSDTKKWLVSCENVCKNCRLTITSNIAGLRGLLITAERGVKPNEIGVISGSSKRKIIESTIAYCIKSASELLTDTIRKDADRISEAERMMMKIITAGISRKLIVMPKPGEDNTEYLKNVWAQLSSQEDIIGLIRELLCLVGPNDILILLDRTINYYK